MEKSHPQSFLRYHLYYFQISKENPINIHSFTDINECESEPCLNGGTCANGNNQYTCSCVAGYQGTNCETSKSILLNSLYNLCNTHSTSVYFMGLSSSLSLFSSQVTRCLFLDLFLFVPCFLAFFDLLI